jgi:agmatinase
MADLTFYDPNSVGNPDNNIFGLPTTEDEARLVILPIPWEVTVSYNAGTARAPEHILNASLQVDLFDPDITDSWKQGFYMRNVDKKVLTKSDYLRKEAELYINYISHGEIVAENKFMCKSLKEINAGSIFLNSWVYEQTKELLERGKLVGLLGGDHSTPFGYIKAIAEKYPDFGILQIDAHCDLRDAYEGFIYSHASIMYNVLKEIDAVKKLVQVGIRDFCDEELDYINQSNGRVVTFLISQSRNASMKERPGKILLTILFPICRRIFSSALILMAWILSSVHTRVRPCREGLKQNRSSTC